MIPLPKWIKDIFDKGHCPHEGCHAPLNKKGVFGVGIREEKQGKKRTHSFCYEYECSKCQQRTVFTGFPTSFEDFIGDLIDIANLPFPDTKTGDSGVELEAESVIEEHFIGGDDGDEDDEDTEIKPPKKSGMTSKEIADGIRLINDSLTFEDLLDNLGIAKLGKEKKKDENK